MQDFIQSLNLADKLSPLRNKEIVWFYVFLPSLVTYFVILTSYINSKPSTGSIETLHPSFTPLVYASKYIEIISTDSVNADGLLWINDEAASLDYLMFSDTVENRIYKWEEGKGMFTVGKTIYIEGSGCRVNATGCQSKVDPGSNGLLRKAAKSMDLLVCQHGERAISLLRDNGTRSYVATHFNHSRLNAPNDLIVSPDGHLYFTDPLSMDASHSLSGGDSDITDQASVTSGGIYMVRSEHLQVAFERGAPTEEVWLMDSSLMHPEGLAFSPDFSKLYVSNSDRHSPIVKVFDVADNGILKNGRVFFNASQLYLEECGRSTIADINVVGECIQEVGLPNGMKVDIRGNLFVAGPGGVLVLSPEGSLIGRFRLDRPVSSVAFGDDGRLYFSAREMIARIAVRTKPNRVVQ